MGGIDEKNRMWPTTAADAARVIRRERLIRDLSMLIFELNWVREDCQACAWGGRDTVFIYLQNIGDRIGVWETSDETEKALRPVLDAALIGELSMLICDLEVKKVRCERLECFDDWFAVAGGHWMDVRERIGAASWTTSDDLAALLSRVLDA